MRIFVEGRGGTPITPEESVYLQQELGRLEKLKDSPTALAEEVRQLAGLCGSWETEMVLQCIDADEFMIRETLKTGRVWEWTPEKVERLNASKEEFQWLQ